MLLPLPDARALSCASLCVLLCLAQDDFGAHCSGSVEVLKLDLGSGQIVSQSKHRGSIATGLPGSVLNVGRLVAVISSDGRSLCTASVTGVCTSVSDAIIHMVPSLYC